MKSKMDISTINLVYFSATYSTRKVVRLIARQIIGKFTEYDITRDAPGGDAVIGGDSLLIVGMPVYAGRIPAGAAAKLGRFKGNNTPAIIVCVYGNRDYDDALLEMKDIVEGNGFRVIAAGAFIAMHSIFPAVGANRPDGNDMMQIKIFSDKCKARLRSITDMPSFPSLQVKGNQPYKTPGKIPLKPYGSRRCDKCGTCVKLCPAQAIPKDHPRHTNKDLCISCGRCIAVCPQKARRFGGLLYFLARRRFVKANSARKEPQFFF